MSGQVGQQRLLMRLSSEDLGEFQMLRNEKVLPRVVTKR